MKIHLLTFLGVVACAGGYAGPLHYLVVPNARESTVGNSSDGADTFLEEFRVQQVFGRGQFPDGDLWITEIAWRVLPDTGPAEFTSSSAKLYFSTTKYAPNTFGSNIFITDDLDNNLGPDNTLVFSGPISAYSPGCRGAGPCPFDQILRFDRPFRFNRSRGFLLMDLIFSDMSATGEGDAESYDFPPGGAIATAASFRGESEVEAGGSIVRFGYLTGVPEPGTGLLLAAALAMLGIRGRRRGATGS